MVKMYVNNNETCFQVEGVTIDILTELTAGVAQLLTKLNGPTDFYLHMFTHVLTESVEELQKGTFD